MTQPQFVAFRGFVIMAQKLFLDDNAFLLTWAGFFSCKGHMDIWLPQHYKMN